jgi:hypothetical protein
MFTPSSPTKLQALSLLLINRDDACLASLSIDDVAMMSSSQNMKLQAKYSTTTEHNPPGANYCCGRGNDKPKNGCYRSNTHYKKEIVQVLLDCGPNRDQVFVNKDKSMLFPYLKRLVPQL